MGSFFPRHYLMVDRFSQFYESKFDDGLTIKHPITEIILPDFGQLTLMSLLGWVLF